MKRVIVSGATGKMGREVLKAVTETQDMEVVAGFDPYYQEKELVLEGYAYPIYKDLDELLSSVQADVMVDFTRPDAVIPNIKKALSAGVDCVVGTTGISKDEFERVHAESADKGAHLFVAPNFTTGAVLVMVFSQMAAKFFPDAEVIEFHHNAKKDAPSGTAVRTAELIAEARKDTNLEHTALKNDCEVPGFEGARGAFVDEVAIHSVRSNGYVAHQEVIFGSKGQTLTIRHDSIERASYMPGVILAIQKIDQLDGFSIGLENLMDLS